MNATKNFLMSCAEAGHCPIGSETWSYLDDLEIERGIDWVEYCEHDYDGRDGRQYSQDCISIESARRLCAEGLANIEIENFVHYWGDFAPA